MTEKKRKKEKKKIHAPICSIHNSQDVETTQMSMTDEWIKKMWYIYTIVYYSAIKKDNAICSNMDATRDSHTE